jgi:uncharacterized protein (TIGR00369 family)
MKITSADIAQVNKNPLYLTLGIRILEVGEGYARSQLEPTEIVCWPFPGQPHGGILYTLVDTTMAWAILPGLEAGYNCATIHLDIQYTSPAKGRRFFLRVQDRFSHGPDPFHAGGGAGHRRAARGHGTGYLPGDQDRDEKVRRKKMRALRSCAVFFQPISHGMPRAEWPRS